MTGEDPDTELKDDKPTEVPADDSPTPDGSFDQRAREESPTPNYGRGSALTDEDALEITSRTPTTVVVFAGPAGSGKTTLIAALYERFGRGPVGGQHFAGSRTLPGLEQRSFGGRVRSGRRFAEMPHTSLDAIPWLHLRLRPSDNSAPAHDVLFGDFFGEHFDRMIAHTMTADTSEFMLRADHVCITLDGALLARAQTRQAQRRRALDLVNALLDQGQAERSQLSLVVTKWDRVHLAGDDVRDAVDQITDEVVRAVSLRDPEGELPVFLTAAKSTISQLPLGHGLDELLTFWLEFPRAYAPIMIEGVLTPASESPFDRFHA
jgi:hypothetical protein